MHPRQAWPLLKHLHSRDSAGLFFILPCTDSLINVDMRTITFDIPPQEVRIAHSQSRQTSPPSHSWDKTPPCYVFHPSTSHCSARKVLTKDSVTVSVDGVVYYRVQNAILAVANITNADAATRLLAQTTLRNVLGTKNLAEILSDREEIAHSMQVNQRNNINTQMSVLVRMF